MKPRMRRLLRYDIVTFPADFTLQVLYQKWNDGDITIPKFQRSFVWDVPRASRLIESIMMGLPVPPIFLYLDGKNKYLVIDGMQRLTSVFSFMRGSFDANHSPNRPFALKGINDKSRWHGKTLEEFDDADRRELKNYVLRAMIIKQIRPENDNTSIYHIFQRLNTGGMMLLDQEVRNCVYAGDFNDLLIRLNQHDGWRNILGKRKEDPRKRDVGYLLRCISLLHNSKKYKKPMRDFLSRFMAEKKNPPNEYIESQERLFKKTCDVIIEKLGNKPFHRKKTLSPSVLDSVFVAFARHPNSCPPDIQDRFNLLLEDSAYSTAVSGATTDPDSIKKRLARANEILFG